MTYFNYERIAKGYLNDRPHFHSLVMDMLKTTMKIEKKLDNGLDVGCGTGSSAVALRKICRNVVGVDEAEAMLRLANQVHSSVMNLSFKQCSAEELKFEEDSVDIVTVCGAINWIDEKVFLPNIHRTLKNEGILLIYDNYISDKMERNKKYTEWWYEEYLKHFPKPTRKENIWKNEEVLPYGFTIYKQEKYTNTVSMTKEEFVRFIVTQSNVIAKVEQGDLSEKETMDWFRRTLKPVFQEKIHKLVFEGYNWYLINHKNKYE